MGMTYQQRTDALHITSKGFRDEEDKLISVSDAAAICPNAPDNPILLRSPVNMQQSLVATPADAIAIRDALLELFPLSAAQGESPFSRCNHPDDVRVAATPIPGCPVDLKSLIRTCEMIRRNPELGLQVDESLLASLKLIEAARASV